MRLIRIFGSFSKWVCWDVGEYISSTLIRIHSSVSSLSFPVSFFRSVFVRFYSSSSSKSLFTRLASAFLHCQEVAEVAEVDEVAEGAEARGAAGITEVVEAAGAEDVFNTCVASSDPAAPAPPAPPALTVLIATVLIAVSTADVASRTEARRRKKEYITYISNKEIEGGHALYKSKGQRRRKGDEGSEEGG